MTDFDPYDDDVSRSRTPTIVRFVLGLVILPFAFCLVMFFWDGRIGVEKALTVFARPDGILWCLLTSVIFVAWPRCDRMTVSLLCLVWLLFTVGGNSILANQAARHFEEPYLANNPMERDQPFDYVVLLGGSLWYGPNKTAALNASGDRLIVATRMYFEGKTNRLICTGSNIESLENDDTPSPAELARTLLIELNVPEEDILLVEGRNTSEEMANLRRLFNEELPSGEPYSIGLVTSAWHMPRALRLAQEQGLAFEAVPADFRYSNDPVTPLSLIPSTVNLSEMGSHIKEWLARLVGR